MADYFELDFLDVESPKSGDAITVRYQTNGASFIHVVDGGFQATGDSVVAHINKYYGQNAFIDFVVLTHPDGDHAGGLRVVLEEMQVGQLWMFRPWLYAEELIDRFATYNSVEHLERRLKEIYPNVAALEEIAIKKGIPIYEPYQGQVIGAFTVMAPTRQRYLDLIVDSERTPESVEEAERSALSMMAAGVEMAARSVMNLVRSAWGEEVFSPNETSAENEMSVVQYANLCNSRILLTGDAGRSALTEAADFAPNIGLVLPGIERFQVPHHGSRRNVSTDVLDRWLGPRMSSPPAATTFTALISSALKDKDHPRKSVVRAMVHRGGKVFSTEGKALCSSGGDKPNRGWNDATPMTYPDDQEDD